MKDRMNKNVSDDFGVPPPASKIELPATVEQLTPDLKYKLVRGTDISRVLAIGSSQLGSYKPNSEYWSLTSAFVTAMNQASNGDTLQFVAETYDTTNFPMSGGYAMFKNPTAPTWSASASTPPTGFYYSSGTTYVGLVFSLTPPSGGGSQWSGSLTWYRGVASGGSATGPVVPSSGITLTRGSAPQLATGYSWYEVTLSPDVA